MHGFWRLSSTRRTLHTVAPFTFLGTLNIDSTAHKGAMHAHEKVLLSVPLLPLLLRMSAPNTLAFCIQATVVLAEVWFISQLGTAELAAVTLAFPIIMLTQQMAFGALGGAVASAIARSLGGGDTERAERLLWHSLVIALCAGVIFLLVFLGLGKALLSAMGGHELVLAEAMSYCVTFLSGAILIWLSGTLSAALRGMGSMRFPAMTMIMGSGIQVTLAGGLILGWFGLPKLGLVGAPLSVIANGAFVTVINFVKLSHHSARVQLKLSQLLFEKALFKDIFNVALPAFLAPVLNVGTIILLTGLVGQFGDAALAGYGLGTRLEFLMIPLIFSVGTAMSTLVGIHVGAGKIARAESIGWLGGFVTGVGSGIIGLTLVLTSHHWITLFTADSATYLVAKQYIEIVGLCFAFQGVGLSLYLASQGANTMKWAVIATILRFVVAIFGGWVAVNYFSSGLLGVFYSSAAAMSLYGLMIAVSLKMGAWRRH